MGLSEADLKADLDLLAKRDPHVRRWLDKAGYPAPRSAPAGYAALLRTLVGQQLSVTAARTIWDRLSATLGDAADPAALLDTADDLLRAAGLSRPKIGYARGLAEAVRDGRLDFARLRAADDAEAAALIVALKGFGQWSAEIYLMFAEGRRDLFPANDLGLQEGLKRMLRLRTRPDEAKTAALGAKRAPCRTAFALMVWHVHKVAAPKPKPAAG